MIRNRLLAAWVLCAALPAIALPVGAQPVPPTSAPTISSQGQTGGVVANSVGVVQNINPRVKSPYLSQFQQFYAKGGEISRYLLNSSIDDAGIDRGCEAAENWINAIFNWTRVNVTPAAGERLIVRTGLSYTWSLSGEHAPGEKEKRDNCLNAMTTWLDNLDALMRSDAMYPQ
jgi:hypothetical protein